MKGLKSAHHRFVVNWQSLSDSYRGKTLPLWEKYGLFSLSGHTARLGGGKKDLAMVFTYACLDDYVKEGGRLGFIITQTLFKTKGAGDGFRRFQLGNKEYFKVFQVDDLSDFQPFHPRSAHTSGRAKSDFLSAAWALGLSASHC